ncbi:hypothetical protein AAMO2058_000273400 [Amorphochlora amoebiformis]
MKRHILHGPHIKGLKKRKGEWVTGAGGTNNNDRMHPRNVYKGNQPDFGKLAEKYRFFAEHVQRSSSGKPYIDFKNQDAVVALNKALLKEDFKLDWNMPTDKLCPPVANRLNYVLWLQDLLKLNRPTNPSATVKGIDIGTGASCIYPLLGVTVDDSWKFLATDIDTTSLENAQRNINANNLQSRIELRKVDPSTRLVGVLNAKDGNFDFCMCNPPFFASPDEMKGNENTTGVGKKEEVLCEGGEEEFVGGILKDSIKLRTRIRWYTSMLGKKNSVKSILRLLRENGVRNVVTTEFLQGHTTRWAIGWCFDEEKPEESGLRCAVNKQVAMNKMKARKIRNRGLGDVITFTVPYDVKTSASVVQPRLHDVFKEWKKKGYGLKVEDNDERVKIDLDIKTAKENLTLSLQVNWSGSKGQEGMEDAVAVVLLSAEPEGTGRQQFLILSSQMKADILRVNRRWRRLMER